MVKVTLNDTLLAESNDTIVVEGNHYFPPAAVSSHMTKDSPTTTFCPWKGTAHYLNADVHGQTVRDAAWYYPHPKDAASHIKDYVAFYPSKVHIEE